MHAALAATATLVALAFGAATLERYVDRRKPHELAWSIALALFAGASAALWAGVALGWQPWSFRLFYALGAVANVPVLALGTVWLLAGPRAGRAASIAVALMVAWAVGVVLAAPLGPLGDDPLPRGSEVFGALPRALAAVGSGIGALVLFGGAVVSAVRLARRRTTRRLAAANGLIALGTAVLSAGGLFTSVLDETDAFALALAGGIAVLFAGFLLTASPAPAASAHPASEHPGVVPLRRTS